MKIDFKDPKKVTLQTFVQDAKTSVVDLNNNECDEIVITKDQDQPFIVMMKYNKLRNLIDGMVRKQIREIDDVVARAIPTVDMDKLTPAQVNLLKIRTMLECFNNMSEADVMNVTTNVAFIHCNSKEMIFDQGQYGEQVFFILKGNVKVFAYNNEEENAKFRMLATLEAGSVLGEMSPITKEPRSARILAGPDGAVLLAFEFHKDIGAENEKQMFQLYKNFINVVSKKLVAANDKLTKRH